MRVVVCGSRYFDDPIVAYGKLEVEIKALPEPSTVIEGEAAGIDRAAAVMAMVAGHEVIGVPAKWKEHSDQCHCQGQSWCVMAGFRRNLKMLGMAPDLVIAVWNGTSSGTKHTIDSARDLDIPVKVIVV